VDEGRRERPNVLPSAAITFARKGLIFFLIIRKEFCKLVCKKKAKVIIPVCRNFRFALILFRAFKNLYIEENSYKNMRIKELTVEKEIDLNTIFSDSKKLKEYCQN